MKRTAIYDDGRPYTTRIVAKRVLGVFARAGFAVGATLAATWWSDHFATWPVVAVFGVAFVSVDLLVLGIEVLTPRSARLSRTKAIMTMYD
jgi:hypothetical protein